MGLRSWIIWKGADLGYGLVSKILWPRASAVAFVVVDKKLLAVDTGDYFMLPGGGLEYGETFEDAAKREVFEETGYRIEIRENLDEGVNSVGGAEIVYEAELLEEEQIHEGSWEGKTVWIDLVDIIDKEWRYNRDVKSLLDAKQS